MQNAKYINCNTIFAKQYFSTKRLMGPGAFTRRSRRIRDVNFGLIKIINGTRISIAQKMYSAEGMPHIEPDGTSRHILPILLLDETKRQSAVRTPGSLRLASLKCLLPSF